MKSLLLAPLLIIFLVGCSSDDDSSNPPNGEDNAPSLRLTKIILDVNDPVARIELSHTLDDNGRLRTLQAIHTNGNVFTTHYNYTNGRITSLEYENISENPLRTFSYDGERIVSSVWGDKNYTYTYNSLGRLTQIDEYVGDHLNCSQVFSINAQGNVTEKMDACHATIAQFEYDTQKNPQTLLFDEPFLNAFAISRNNSVSEVFSVPSEDMLTKTYEYNEEGYPTIENVYRDGELLYVNQYIYEATP